MRSVAIGLVAWTCGTWAWGAEGIARQPLVPVPVPQVNLDGDAFWGPKREVWRKVTIPDCLAKFEKDGAIGNFENVRDGKGAGTHAGPPWYDGLIYEMIRGCADFLATRRDPALEARLDGYIDVIAAAAAKDPDGYLETWTLLKEPTHRFGMNGGNDNWQHDVYNAGAMAEAAVHYYRATGKTALLKVAVRMIHYMTEVIGPPPRRNVIPGHSIAEEALVKLYRLFVEVPGLKREMPVPVDEVRYLRLAEFFIEARGHHEGRKSFDFYGQDHKPVFEQESIEGHAVRATLMAAGVAAIAGANGRPEYRAATRRLWDNFTGRRLYITGGAGATAQGEAFAPDYVLPNDGYLETCAAIGGAFFDHDANLLFVDARYADELERVVYNSAPAGVSLAGNTYSYVNPLQFERGHSRWAWHGCPCCPPMFVKIMGALPGYVYAQDDRNLYVNLFVGSRAEVRLLGRNVALRQTTRYPWEGTVRLEVSPPEDLEFALRVRVPAWCQHKASDVDLYRLQGVRATGAFQITINGQPPSRLTMERGYAVLDRVWHKGDVVEWSMEMPVRRVKAHPAVKACEGRVALQRGPVVYAVETTGPDFRARNVFLPADAPLSARFRPDVLGGVTLIGAGFQARIGQGAEARPVDVEAIPYFAYGNRGQSDLRVWLPERREDATPETIATGAKASASHCWGADTVAAIHDGAVPAASRDTSVRRLSWWDHQGTREWAQLDFPRPTQVAKVRVFWFADRFNEVRFSPVTATALRLDVQLQPGWSGGISEWEVE